MVKRIIIFIVVLPLASCAFFGSSMFSTAYSEDLGDYISGGDIVKFYILNNGIDDELLILVSFSGPSDYRIVILDTSLNIRGVLTNGEMINTETVDTNGVGFVDWNYDFVIGNTKIERYGTTGYILNPGTTTLDTASDNNFVFRWNGGYGRILNTGFVDSLDNVYAGGTPTSMFPTFSATINQSEIGLSDIYFIDTLGGFYRYTKDVLLTLVSNPELIFTLSNLNTSKVWATRCDRGFFISNESEQEYILYDYNGNEINSVKKIDYRSEIVTIDYDSEYYYVVDYDNNRILKERLPF